MTLDSSGTPPKPFTSDGCSGGMSLVWKIFSSLNPPWEGICVDHDKRYWAGGSASERKAADAELLLRMRERGHPYIGLLMYLSVRAFGHPYLPLGWRWGYGWPYPSAGPEKY